MICKKSLKKYLSLCSLLLIVACSTSPTHEDPLRNTKKLVSEGHRDLYENGAFQVPSTEIKLIPPGPSTLDFVGELGGLHARQAFLLSLKNAQSAVYLISNGTKKSYQIGKDVYGVGDELAKSITKFSRPQSKLLVMRSAADAYGIAGASFQLSKSAKDSMQAFSLELNRYSGTAYDDINSKTELVAKDIASGSQSAKAIHAKTTERSSEIWQQGRENFVKGYLALPQKLRETTSKSSKAKEENFAEMRDSFSENEKWLSENSDKMQSLVKESGSTYFSNIGNSLGRARSDFTESITEEGVSFATLKAGRWVLQALFYDAMIAPLSKATYGSLGYIFVNGIAYPVMLAKDGSLAVTNTAVQYTWDGVKMVGAVVAPTFEAAFAGVIAGGNLIGGEAVAGGAYVGSKAGTALVTVTGKIAAVVVRGGGYIASQGIYYIGVPMTTVGLTAGGTAVGAVYGVGEAVTGSAIYIGGEAAQVSSRVVGTTVAAGTMAVGTVGSAAVGGGLAVYELGKAVAVPTGYELGSGIVLGYTATTHLAAQSVLAVSDAAYLVLSLEGPRWVIYAVKGKIGNGGKLVPGTVMDLKQMRTKGEEFLYVPASDSEVKSVIEALPQDLIPQPGS